MDLEMIGALQTLYSISPKSLLFPEGSETLLHV